MSLTYPEVGATAGELPRGYHHFRRTTLLRDADLETLADALFTWEVHRAVGLRVPTTPRAASGVVSRMRLGVGPLAVPVPCEVVYVVDEPDRRGFAYGTLPPHPERGEALFLLTRRGPDVEVEIKAFSRPAWTVLRPAGPIIAGVVELAIRHYLGVMGSLSR